MSGTDNQQRYRTLIDLGIALSAERNHDRLMELILKGAKSMTNADGGTLYTMNDERNALRFEIMLNDTLNVAMGGTTGNPIPFYPLKLFVEDGSPNHKNVSSYCALEAKTVNIVDAYNAEHFDFSGTKAFDNKTGYRSKSFLTVPLKNRDGIVIGVLQLINARAEDGSVIEFSSEISPLIEALASQAAVAMDNSNLIQAQKRLFQAFIKLLAGAIDAKSPYTGGHCNRVPVITEWLTRAAYDQTEGPFADFSLNEDQWYELQIASDLHDCGKVTTPEYVVDKATKLETIYNRIHEIRMRFEVLKRDATIECQDKILAGGDAVALKAELAETHKTLDEEFSFVAECNVGGEFMAPEKVERLNKIAERTWLRTLDDRLGISNDEARFRDANEPPPPVVENLLADKKWHLVPHEKPIDTEQYIAEGIKVFPPEYRFNRGELYNLAISRGTLTNEDRFLINDHIIQSIMMLRSLPFPKSLAKVPEIAGGHHEKMDGTGYPKRLKREEMSVPARAMAIADIFEALTAADRPYKKPKKLSEAIKIMSFMVKDQHVDPDLFQLFLTTGIWKRYADEFLMPEQVDDVDISAYIKKAAE
jgi:HD-GYP domain-containing protein (c-di-GMP phosphodiesterase class II)